MLSLLAAIAFQSTTLPEKAAVEFSGIPGVTGQNIAVESHSVTITLTKQYADVSSLTLIKNNGPAGNAGITVSMGVVGTEMPSDPGLTGTWANVPIAFNHPKRADQLSGIPPYEGFGKMQNLGTYALRLHYRLPIGHSGLGHKQFLAAYDLTSLVPIGTLMVTYTYGPGVVFHEPEAGPNIGWQIGQRGAFVKLAPYDGKTALSYCAFYNAGFGG
ncbi:MAG TPA: hypothetical protein VMI31_18215 [Fimbriimonadaceae bacterium]|nr:hypothetical protein [Fimbriimonadaceae bacterium]